MSTAPPTHPPLLPLPPKPERPDCCAGSCAICVLDGYFEEVQAWEREVAAIETKNRSISGQSSG